MFSLSFEFAVWSKIGDFDLHKVDVQETGLIITEKLLQQRHVTSSVAPSFR